MHDELAMLLLIVFAVFVIMPAKNRILAFILQQRKIPIYPDPIMSDVELPRHPMNVESLFSKDFPLLAAYLGLQSAALIVLEPNRKAYRLYSYRKKKKIAEQLLSRRKYDRLFQFLAKVEPGSLLRDNKALPEGIAKDIHALEIDKVYPFSYRKVPMGFFIFQKDFQSSYANHVLEIFRHKAALAVQNSILAHRVIDGRIYEREFTVAERVRKALFFSDAPKIKSYSISHYEQDFPLMLNYFPLQDNHWLFMAIYGRSMRAAQAILTFSIVGHIYSFIHLHTKTELHSLLSSIKEHEDWIKAEHSLALLLMKLDTQSNTLEYLGNKAFSIYKNYSSKRDAREIHRRRHVDLQEEKQSAEIRPGFSFDICCAKAKFLTIAYDQNEN